MLALDPNNIYFFTLGSTAILGLLVTLPIIFKWKIQNPSFSLVRALATFAAVWLLWGKLSGDVNPEQMATQAVYVQIGAFKYLTLQFTLDMQKNWLASAQLELTSLLLTLVVTLVAAFGISLILSKLANISDRRR
jgi:Kef-type K+ transport system membrane component KefB